MPGYRGRQLAIAFGNVVRYEDSTDGLYAWDETPSARAKNFLFSLVDWVAPIPCCSAASIVGVM